ncbi:MAG: metallophosphoesterase [Acidobacteria bacterium]|nr:metallophosphoesterase [Acidobacteriota bacterium]MBV9625542.1 metallophosphoesterase [Acidobacteriota bacterium]
MKFRRRFIIFVAILQSVLFCVHFLLYETWTFSPFQGRTAAPAWLKLVLTTLSLTFVPASLLAFRYTNMAVRMFYRAAAVWAGLLSFFFIAAACCWIIFAVASVAELHPDFHRIMQLLFGLAALAGLVAIINASWTRVTRATVQLANLPAPWRGRKAALISDLHLGHVRNAGFLRRMIRKISREEPHAIFIAGDLYDGTAIDAARAAEPLNQLTAAPHGVYFVAGNHEQFRDDSKYLRAVAAAGVRVLNNEKIEVDGLQIAGIPYRNAWHPESFASVLRGIRLDRERASILLTHAPDHPEIAESQGISLQLSGHTHLGQFIPWSWIARRIYRQFAYGLSRIGNMQVFTSSGAGTWGPPMRLGSNPEIVVLQFE